VPLYHVTGLVDQFLQMLWLGGQCRLLPRYDTAAMLRSLVVDEISVLVGVPALFSLLVRRPPRSSLALRLAIYGGAPMASQTVHALVEQVPGVRPVQGYGMTEISSLATALPAKFALTTPDSVGVPSPITELRLMGQGHEEVAGTGPDACGEILLRGPHRTPGYWNRPDLTDLAIDADGWLHSGDLGWRDDDGLLHWSARISQLINRGGEKISPRDIECALLETPGVVDAIAFSTPDDVLYQVPAAAVVCAPDAVIGEDALHRSIAGRLDRIKRPVKIWVVDSFPLGPTGKVDVAAITRGASGP
jgi:acyl-CoA synthetase (AMP-forming)/AMP-acid ligase II